MVEVRSFESPEAMRTYMERVLAEANRGLAPQQRMIERGEHWVRFMGPHIEYGYVYLPDEIEAECAGEDTADALLSVWAAEERGFLFGKAWSRLEPDGVIGTTHRSAVWPIEPRLFQSARNAGWHTLELPEWALVLLRFAEMGSRPYRVAGL